MKNITSLFLFILINFGFFASISFAETQYIKDEIRIEMHSGPTTGYRIIRYLKSGDTLAVIKHSTNGKWLNIDARGKTGWIQSKFATPKPIAKALLKTAKQHVSTLTSKNASLESQLLKARSELKAIKALQKNVTSSNAKLKAKLSGIEKVASNAINTERSYQLLQEKTELLNVSLEKLEEENKILANDNLKDGIMWGILAIIVGVILAVTAPKMSNQKRKSEW